MPSAGRLQPLVDGGLPEAVVWEGELDLRRGRGEVRIEGILSR